MKTWNDSERIECILQNWRRQAIKKTLCMIPVTLHSGKTIIFPNYSQWLCSKMIIRCLSSSLAQKTVYTIDFFISCILYQIRIVSELICSPTKVEAIPLFYHFQCSSTSSVVPLFYSCGTITKRNYCFLNISRVTLWSQPDKQDCYLVSKSEREDGGYLGQIHGLHSKYEAAV